MIREIQGKREKKRKKEGIKGGGEMIKGEEKEKIKEKENREAKRKREEREEKIY